MATIKYLLQSKSSTAPIYLRLSLGREESSKRKTGYVYDSKKWSVTTGFPKDGDAAGKSIKSNLKKLEGFVIECYNTDNSKGILIDGEWLTVVIDRFHGREAPKELDYLVEYGESFIEKLPYRVTAKGNRGVDKSTVTKYKTIVLKLRSFEKSSKKKYFVKDVNLKFRDDFIRYLTEVEKINDNTAGRYISFIKTIVLDARKNGIDISPQINDFKGFTVKPPIVTLTLDEIQKIKETTYDSNNLEISRDWLLIGCFTGQRVSDLLRMNKSMISEVSGYKFIELEQVKTKKTVQIPIHYEVELILNKRNGEFPPLFAKTQDSNSTMFNLFLKDVCRIAEIDESVEGNLNNKSTNRYEKGKHPKWKLISSHSCRRSFCTNFYAQRDYPTPLLMSVSGHATESMFLEYIGKKPMDYALQLAEIWASKALEEKSKNKGVKKLTVLRSASNI
jgi:integrase